MLSLRLLKNGVQELETREKKFLFLEETPIATLDKQTLTFNIADIFRSFSEVEKWINDNKMKNVSIFVSYSKLQEIKEAFHEHFAI